MLKIAENGEKSSHFASLRSAAQLISDFRGETRGIGWDLAPETVGWDGMGSHLAKKWWDGMGWDWVLVGSHGMGWDGIEYSVPSSNSAHNLGSLRGLAENWDYVSVHGLGRFFLPIPSLANL